VEGQTPYTPPDLLPVPRHNGQTRFPGRRRDAEAARLAALNWPLDEIAVQLGFDGNPDTMCDRVVAAIKRHMASVVQFSRDENRLMTLQSLELLKHTLSRMLEGTEMFVVSAGHAVPGQDGRVLKDHRFKLEIVDRLTKIEQMIMDLQGTKSTPPSIIVSGESLDATIAALETQVAMNKVPSEDAGAG
jgi:hypothetical protein